MKLYYTILMLAGSLLLMSFDLGPVKTGGIDDEVEKQVEKLLSEMTLEEKVGQMTQVTLDVVAEKKGVGDSETKLDLEKLRTAIVDYKVGSILNVTDGAITRENWHKIINTIQDMALEETRLSIPILYGIDAIHGANYSIGATIFPQAINMAATRNRELVRLSAEITAYEIRACGIPWNFNPVLGMGREPYWPRLFETFGEDVYLTTQMGNAYIKGQQGSGIGNDDRAAVCIKHFVGYSVPNTGQDRTPAWIPDRMLREIFLPPFKAGVESGAMTLMINSAEINGIPTHADHHLLTEILKEEFGFQGFAVSDWEDIKRLHTRDRVAATPKEAVKMAVLAGVDMSMVPNDFSFYTHLLDLVKEGSVPESRIDDAVRRILRVKVMLGLMENPYPKEGFEKYGSEEFTNINKQAALESITLLKNESDILPLSKDVKVLVTGPTADRMTSLNGGWTLTWQGDEEHRYPEEKHTFLEAVISEIGQENVTYVEGASFTENVNIEEAVEQAKNCDAILLCLGEDAYCETPGNITDLSLEESQIELALALAALDKPVILVLFQGRPRLISAFADDMKGIVLGYLPGFEGADATVDVIFGDYNPSGKLPYTYPKTPRGYTTYDYKPIEKFDVNDYLYQYPFGYGLSYTTFEYNGLTAPEKVSSGDDIKVSINVVNTGDRAGKETVELYLTDLYGSTTRPGKSLKRFEKIHLEPGEEKTVEFVLNKKDLSFVGIDNSWITEPGEFVITVGSESCNFILN